MKRTFADSAAFRAGCKMPPGQVHQPRENYDPHDSQVCCWLADQNEVLQYIFNKMVASGAIIYDAASRSWRGRDSS